MKKTTVLLIYIGFCMIFLGCSNINRESDKINVVSDTKLVEDNENANLIEQKDTNKKIKKIKIATAEYLPYISEDLDGYGFNSEIVTEAFKVKGYEVEYVFENWSRTIESTRSGNVFGSFPWGKTEERLEEFIWSDTILIAEDVIWYMEGTDNIPEDFDGFDSIRNLKSGGVLSYSCIDLYDANNVPIEKAPSEKEALKKLYNGRVDIMPGTKLTTLCLIKELYPNETFNFKYLKTPFFVNEMGLMTSKKNLDNKKIIEDFNEGLKEIYHNGILEKILVKYDMEMLFDGYKKIME
jgi:polar amino acid transport system substrate-binding protein